MPRIGKTPRAVKTLAIQVVPPGGGPRIELHVYSGQSIRAGVKKLLEDKYRLRPGEIRLVCEGRALDESKSLEECGVQSGAELYCKTISRAWTSNNFLLTQVASFLSPRAVLKLMAALNDSSRMFGDAELAPPAPRHLGRDVTYGGPGGTSTTNYRVPAGWRLAGFFGGVGGHLHNLGVVIAKDPA